MATRSSTVSSPFRKLWALHRSAPLALPVILFLAGQLLGDIGGGSSLPIKIGYFAGATALLAVLRRSQLGLSLLWFALGGAMSVLIHSLLRPPLELDAASAYLAEVETAPRHRQVGAVELQLLLRAQVLHPQGAPLSLRPLSTPSRVLCSAIDLPWKNISQADVGSLLLVQAAFTPYQRGLNPFSFEANLWRKRISARCRIRYATAVLGGEMPYLSKLRNYLVALLEEALGAGERSGLLLSIGLGIPDKLSLYTENAFKRAGLTHLLVFSGYQVGLIYSCSVVAGGWFLALISSCGMTARFSHWPLLATVRLVALIPATTLAAISGLDGSSSRACLAALFSVCSGFLEREGAMLNSIFFSLLVLSAIWPGIWLEPGAQLTYGALFAIWLAQQHSDPGAKIAQFIRTMLYVWVVSSCLTLLWFGNASPVGFLMNLVFAVPAGFVACNLGVSALALYALGLDPSGYALRLCAAVLEWLRDVVIWSVN